MCTYPVLYSEPFERNRVIIGLDFASEPARLPALLRARDTGEPTASERFALATTGQDGFFLAVPVYAGGGSPATVAERRAALLGFALGLFWPDETIATALRGTTPIGLPFELIDTNAPSERRLLARWEPRLKPVDQWRDRLLPAQPIATVDVTFAGRQWRLIYRPNRAYLQRHYPQAFWLTLPSGLLVTAILVMYLGTLLRQREHLAHSVQQRTRQLRESEETYRQLFEMESDALFLLDTEAGRIVQANDAASALYGYSREELLRLRTADLSDEPEETRQVIRDGVTFVPVRWHQRKDGTRFPVEITGRRFEWRGRQVYIAAVRDITERRAAEEALAAEKERLSVTLRSIGDGVIATDIAATITAINKVAEDLTGWAAEEAIGRPLSEVFRIVDSASRQPLESPVTRALACEEAQDLPGQILLLSRHGREYAVADSCAPIRDRENHTVGAVLVFRDVTSEWKREEELLKSQRLESLAILAGGIAHDFNNILTGVVGNLSLALSEPGTGERLRQSLTEAESAAMRAKSLTQQLLTFSKGGAPVRKIVNVRLLVREAAIFASHGSAASCRFLLPEALWLADLDEGQIAQVIQNMVINAVQAMPGGGTITIGGENLQVPSDNPLLLAPGPYVRIRITDEGVGIPERLLPRIFDPYFTTKQTGSGLGLSICHSVIVRHGGRIDVSSRQGDGTTFDVYLPASPGAGLPRDERGEAPVTVRGRVLVMDDEEAVSTLAARMLAAIGFEATTAPDGEQAVTLFGQARLSGRPFDLVIVDLTIPGGMGGLEATEKMRALDPDLKAIVSSGYSTDPIMANFRDHGFISVLTKPYRLKDLKEALGRVITRT